MKEIMMYVVMKDRSLQKIKVILKIIKERLEKEPEKETLELSFEELEKFPILSDSIGLNITLERIEEETKKNILIRVTEGYGTYYGDTEDAKDTAYRKIKLPPTILVHIENFEKFKKYYLDVQQWLRQGEEVPTLILNNRGELYRKNDRNKKQVYPMEPDGLRYRVFYYLAEQKGSFFAKELADEFGTTPKKIRKTLGEIKTLIKKNLKIAGGKIIENKRGGGYVIKKVITK